MKENIRSRKGISMVEVVVALVVITIISLATLSVVFVSAKVEAKTVVAMEVRNSAENAVECFRFAGGKAETFISCLNKTIAKNEQEFQQQADGSYISNAGGYKVTIALVRNDQNELIGFDYCAKDSAGKEIYSFTFTNGGGQE